MNTKECEELYFKVLSKWGLQSQLNMLMEECAELIQASSKALRKGTEESWQHLAEEMADVEIMIEQIKLAVPEHNLVLTTEKYKQDKLLRLKSKL